jgi:drug/metabolite transporter (DMT)-like permease
MSTATSEISTPLPLEPRVDLRRGTFWMLASLGSFTGNALLIKHCTTDRHIDPWLAMAFRFAVGFLVTWILFGHSGGLQARRVFLNRLLASRGVMGAFGTAAYYFSIGPLGAGKATLIGNTWTVWAAVIATTVLHERLGVVKFVGILVALVGLGLLTDISPDSLTRDGRWELISLGGAILAALVIVVIRQLTRTETSATIFASQCLYGLLLALPFAIRHVGQLSATDYLLVIAAALCAGMGQLSMTEGFRFLTVAAGGAFQMAVPLLISLGGVFFFEEHFTLAQAAGGFLIVAGSFQTVVGWRWARTREMKEGEVDGGP